jgi:hypothetical protein
MVRARGYLPWTAFNCNEHNLVTGTVNYIYHLAIIIFSAAPRIVRITGWLSARHRLGLGSPIGRIGLWTIDFGVGDNNGDPNTLYFSDGIDGEADGLFGIFANGSHIP